jgi:hypothetical protein
MTPRVEALIARGVKAADARRDVTDELMRQLAMGLSMQEAATAVDSQMLAYLRAYGQRLMRVGAMQGQNHRTLQCMSSANAGNMSWQGPVPFAEAFPGT